MEGERRKMIGLRKMKGKNTEGCSECREEKMLKKGDEGVGEKGKQ